VRENLSFSICTCQLTVSNMGYVKDRCGKPFLPHRITPYKSGVLACVDLKTVLLNDLFPGILF